MNQYGLALVAIVALSAPAMAQINTDVAVPKVDTAKARAGTVALPLAERSYVMGALPNSSISSWYEGNLALHFPLLHRLAGSLDRAYQESGRWRSGGALSFSMLVHLRQTQEESAPVRTPSYMPRIRYQNVWTRRGAGDAQDRVAQWIGDGIVGHYSNGQDGCLFVGQVGPDCLFQEPPGKRDLEVNRLNGNFSSHYLEAGVARRQLRIADANFTDAREYAGSAWSLGVRYRNYTALAGIGGGMTRELRDAYGPHRIRVTGSWLRETNSTRRLPGQLWVDGFIEARPGGSSQVPPVRGSVELGRSFDRLDGTAIFARYYSGHDDYNLGFLTNLNVLRFGVSLGGETRPGFRP